MALLRIEKVLTQLPTTLTANTIYFLKLTGGTVEMYITDKTGTASYLTGGGNVNMDPFLLMGVTNG